jgi:hypothetical protein
MRRLLVTAVCLLMLLTLVGCGKAPVQYTLTISVIGQGTVTPTSGSKYNSGTVVTLVPTPNSGWVFDRWEGTDGNKVVTSGGTYTIVMDKNQSVEAVFSQPSAPVSGVVRGAVTSNGIPEVIIQYSGAVSGQVVTDMNGEFTIPNVTGPITVTPIGPEHSMIFNSTPANKQVGTPSDNVDFSVSGIAYAMQWSVGTGFTYPERVAVDSLGNVYVTTAVAHQVFVYTPYGVELRRWGSEGDGDGEFEEPSGIVVDSNFDVYVADPPTHRIQKFENDGQHLMTWGGYGNQSGQMNEPKGLAIDADDNIYVIEFSGKRVQKFNIIGDSLGFFGGHGTGNGQFNYPTDLALDSDGNLYVVDQYNHRIQKFDSINNYVTQWGQYGSGAGEFKSVEDVEVDVFGNVFVVDQSNSRIQIFSTDGEYIDEWGGGGPGIGQFQYPRGIAIDQAGVIYVADRQNNRIQKFYQIR